MGKRKSSVWIAFGLLAVLLTGCVTFTDDSAAAQSVEPVVSAADGGKADSGAEQLAEEGDLGEYHVKILDCETGLKDCDGSPVIGITYEFTNQSGEAIAFDAALYATAYQDGVELDLALLDGDYPEEYENASRNIKPGKSLICEGYYVMRSKTAPVEAEVTELIALDSGKLVKTFEVKQ